ncbi:hypothetical protein ACFV2X_55495 [Streptomyces sp. NPDC059679]|uniref:hypothetical protein n=1 Tax=Streptomyces sp. NPDC059679 TaxID=3346903 RepID=UPI003681463B
MGYEYHVTGTVTVTPPIALVWLKEVTHGPELPIFRYADDADDPAAAGPWSDMVGIWALTPAEDQPAKVGALTVRHTSKSSGISVPLARFARICVEAGHRVTSNLKFHGECGEHGVIQLDKGGVIKWVETHAPGREPTRW